MLRDLLPPVLQRNLRLLMKHLLKAVVAITLIGVQHSRRSPGLLLALQHHPVSLVEPAFPVRFFCPSCVLTPAEPGVASIHPIGSPLLLRLLLHSYNRVQAVPTLELCWARSQPVRVGRSITRD